MTEPAVGASTWASGSHVWKGNIGTLIAKPTKNTRNTQYWIPKGRLGAMAWKAMMSKVRSRPKSAASWGTLAAMPGYWKYSARIPSNSRTEPISVYRKNLIAAYNFLGPPQTPIRKYIGTSMTSQNT